MGFLPSVSSSPPTGTRGLVVCSFSLRILIEANIQPLQMGRKVGNVVPRTLT